MSLAFPLSYSVLPVGLYHHLMYSMPLFTRHYDAAIEAAPSPVAQTLLNHGTLMVWHTAAFAAVELAGVPRALELQPALPFGTLQFFPSTPGAYLGLLCLCLFGALITLLIRSILHASHEATDLDESDHAYRAANDLV